MLPSKRHFISAQVSSGGLFLDLDGEVDHGDDNGRNAPRHTSELAPLATGNACHLCLGITLGGEDDLAEGVLVHHTSFSWNCLPQLAKKRPWLEVGG